MTWAMFYRLFVATTSLSEDVGGVKRCDYRLNNFTGSSICYKHIIDDSGHDDHGTAETISIEQ